MKTALKEPWAGKKPFLLFYIILVIVSCKKDDDKISDNEIVVNHDLVFTYPIATIQAAIALQAGSYPEASEIIQRISYGVQVFRVTYKTIYRDSVINASGLICVPEGAGSFPIISFQNGTNAFHGDAPSVNPANTGYAVMEIMASNGYIVLIPDYIGFGASSDILHPYYHRESTNNAVIDLIKAFGELDDEIIASGNDSLFLLGYSQGGEATMTVAHEIETNDPVDLNLIAVSAGAGAYDLVDFTNYITLLESYPSPMYFPYFLYSQIEYGSISSPLDLFFREPYASAIPALFDGTNKNSEINNALTKNISELLTVNFLQNYSTGPEYEELRDALLVNSIHGWNTNYLINIYHGTEDDNVPPVQSLNLYDEFIFTGSDPEKVHHIPMEGLSHGSGLFPWGIQTINWFNSLRN